MVDKSVPIKSQKGSEAGIQRLRQTYDPRYWVVHGKSYDLTTFAKRHPGGEYILMLGKGRDCTELFESVHALSGTDGPSSILAKYEVKEEPLKEDIFTWEPNGFYSVVRKRVQERFADRNYKATWFIYAKILVLFCLYMYCWTNAFLSGNFLWAIASGVFTEMIGFCMMHDASHSAISKRAWVNYAGLLWSSWTLWNHWLWLTHHVYGHHSYTGIYGKDPDIHNAEFLVRKHTKSKPNKIHKYQHWYSWLVYSALPNQHLGQAIMYQLIPRLFNKVFIIPCISPPQYINNHSYSVMALSFVWHFAIPLYFQSFSTVLCLWLLNYTFMGISYFINVAPNHDTMETLRNHPQHGQRIDWGENQVRCTGNHSVGVGVFDKVITHLWGGMNFQIEHHLFPALNHAHYYEVSKIVRATCEEFNIPYDCNISWLNSLKSFFEHVRLLAKTPRGASVFDTITPPVTQIPTATAS